MWTDEYLQPITSRVLERQIMLERKVGRLHVLTLSQSLQRDTSEQVRETGRRDMKDATVNKRVPKQHNTESHSERMDLREFEMSTALFDKGQCKVSILFRVYVNNLPRQTDSFHCLLTTQIGK